MDLGGFVGMKGSLWSEGLLLLALDGLSPASSGSASAMVIADLYIHVFGSLYSIIYNYVIML